MNNIINNTVKLSILLLLSLGIYGCTILLIKNNESPVTVHMSDEYSLDIDSINVLNSSGNSLKINKHKYKDTIYLDTLHLDTLHLDTTKTVEN
jgi:hypothetical protein